MSGPVTEVVEWDAKPGKLVLDNGSTVKVRRGDHLLMETDAAAKSRFIEKMGGRA